MKEQIFGFRKKEGTVSVYRKDEMKKLIASLEDGEYEYVLRKKKKIRSNGQNKYYWAICIAMVLEGLIDAGYERKELDANVVHEFLRKMFLKKTIPSETGEFIEVIGHTSDLSTLGMMEYIADIQQWASESLNIYIPSPSEQSSLDFNR